MEQQSGPFLYENWKAANAGIPRQATYEVPLFTDARIAGEVEEGLGPYRLFNTVPITGIDHPSLRPALILRYEEHHDNTEVPVLDMDVTRDDQYHGGGLSEEVAALISLILGVRLKAGGITREFRPDGDPLGRPIEWYRDRHPLLLPVHTQVVLPNAFGTHLLDIKQMHFLPQLAPQDALILVRTARLYQNALWIVESDPALTWLLLVSATETAASHWRASTEPAIDRMRASRPEIETLLNNAEASMILGELAELIAPYMGATSKFVNFILHYLPPPPENRPPPFVQLSWDKPAIKKAMSKVYDYRSKALHGGKPFPAPMSLSPPLVGEGREPSETPLWGTETFGGTWSATDIPMYLHTFEYIVRNCLLRWWHSMMPAN